MMKPQNSEREYAVDDRCALVLTHTDDGPRLRSAYQHAACIRRTKAALEVHRRTKAFNAPVRKITFEDSLQQPLIARACGITRSRCVTLARVHKFKRLRLRVAEPFREETQTVRTLRYSNDVPHHVALVVPKMERAPAMLRREHVLRGAQIEEDFAILKHRSLSVLRKELCDGSSDLFRRLRSGVVRGRGPVRRHGGSVSLIRRRRLYHPRCAR